MSRAGAGRSWAAPAAAGAVLAVVFGVAVTASPAARQHWPLLVLSAVAAALPFMIGGPVPAGHRPLRRHPPSVVEGAASAVPALLASAISLPKAAAVAAENDDAYRIDLENGYLAVADGASSSFRAGEWARLLCATFLAQRPLGAMPSQSWITEATAAFREPARQGGAQAADDWWSTEAARRGAHAAFVGLAVLREDERLSWRATAVGDSVLVHLRAVPEEQPPIVTAFPVSHSASFPRNPTLLSSAADQQPPVAYLNGPAVLGDIWLLMTDELARWALCRHEEGDPAWVLLARGTAADLVEAVAAARASGAVADDDMTVVRCELVHADPLLLAADPLP